MSTVRDLVNGSLRLLGAIAQGEVASAEEMSEAVSSLNELVDSWSTERLAVYSITEEELTLTATQQVYTIGSGGDFDTTRPQRVVKAAIQDQTSPVVELPLKLINLSQWAELSVKAVDSSYPMYLYVESSYPLMKLHLWPVPSTTNKLVLYSWKPLSTFASADTTISLPPGYFRALRYSLALELAPEYGIQPNTAIVANALESKANIKRMNMKEGYLKTDEALMASGGSFNWQSGE